MLALLVPLGADRADRRGRLHATSTARRRGSRRSSDVAGPTGRSGSAATRTRRSASSIERATAWPRPLIARRRRCGATSAAATGSPPPAALGEPLRRARACSSTLAEDALRQAEREIQARGVSALAADLSVEEDLRARAGRARSTGAPAAAASPASRSWSTWPTSSRWSSCSWSWPSEHDFTVVLSVPNDAFWAIENPFHHTMWGEGAFEELRRLLPDDHVVAHQFALQGSLDADRRRGAGAAHGRASQPAHRAVPTHFLVAFGPSASRLAAAAATVARRDLLEQRRWERQRESDLALLQASSRAARAGGLAQATSTSSRAASGCRCRARGDDSA